MSPTLCSFFFLWYSTGKRIEGERGCSIETLSIAFTHASLCFTRSISDECVEHILQHGEAIEDYPHAFPFPAKLLLGRCNGRPIHVVAAENRGAQQVIVITAYEPTIDKWETDMKTRRKRS